MGGTARYVGAIALLVAVGQGLIETTDARAVDGSASIPEKAAAITTTESSRKGIQAIPGDRQKVHPMDARDVRVQGDLDRRIRITVARLLEGPNPYYTDDFILADVTGTPRIFFNFNGDLSGRYLGALSTASRYLGERYGKVDRIAQALLRHQDPDGHFGRPPDMQKPLSSVEEWDMANIYGAGRLLVGLIDYYDTTGDSRVLASARRLGDYILNVFPYYSNPRLIETLHGRSHQPYVYFLQNNEGLVRLGRASGENKYLEAARRLGELMRPVDCQHAHAFLSTLRGMMDYFFLTGNTEILHRVQEFYAQVLSSENALWPCEGIPESFNRRDNDEGCTEGDWMRLNLQLWQATGDAVYVDRAERALFNEVYFTQFDNGDFGYNRITPSGFVVTPRGRQYFCCTMHGLKTLSEVVRSIFGWAPDGISVNLFVDAEATLPEPHAGTIRQEADLFRTGEVKIRLQPKHPHHTALRIRIPAWAGGYGLLLNGRPCSATIENGYATILRTWKKGDEVSVRFRLNAYCLAPAKTRLTSVGDPQREHAVALLYGPLVLAAFETGNADYFRGEARPVLALPRPAPDGSVELPRAILRPDYLNQHAVLVNSFAMLDARFVLRTADGRSVTLCPLAERTGESLGGRVDIWFTARFTP